MTGRRREITLCMDGELAGKRPEGFLGHNTWCDVRAVRGSLSVLEQNSNGARHFVLDSCCIREGRLCSGFQGHGNVTVSMSGGKAAAVRAAIDELSCTLWSGRFLPVASRENLS